MPAELKELVALEPGVSPKEYWIEEAHEEVLMRI